ncbi:FkbM family methyltransferase, partial [Sinomicrobium oceani]|uniref:FkbM family methyltransferase n=1 Tax=Sinomicrobium oceani TaxID=1150368 RepID=UPI00227C4743
IEHALSKVPGIKQSAVIAKERNTDTGTNKYLIGYYVLDKNSVEARVSYVKSIYQERLLEDNLHFSILNKNLSAITFSKSVLEFLYEEIFQSNTYLSNTTIKDGNVIFDVGANIGISSIFFAKQTDNLSIYSFEPIDRLYEVLNMNLFIHSEEATFKTFNCGLGAENKNNVPFAFFRNNTVISTQYPDLEEDSHLLSTFLDNTNGSSNNEQLVNFIIESQEEVLCQIRTISSIIQQEKIERIDLLKIDVEKAELDVLHGIKEQDWDKIHQIIVEVHDKNNRLERMISLLSGKGYEVNVQVEKNLQNTDLYVLYAIRKSTNNIPKSKKNELIFYNNPISELLERYKEDKTKPSFISNDILSDQLKEVIPEYMIPAAL